MYCKIGEDMLVQILSCLPPKALMRFKCVSKRWCAMISSPRFVAKHLSNSMHNNLSTDVLLKRLVRKHTFSMLKLCNNNENGHEHSFLSGVEDIEFPLDISPAWDSVIMIGHCDGIICLVVDDSMDVVLWNPAIQEFKLLPCQPYPRRPTEGVLPQIPSVSCLQREKFIKAMGFGYDPKSKDYKVINIEFSGWERIYGHGPEIYEICDTPKAARYTLCTDSWREINTDSLGTETTILRPEKFHIYFKGMCYWLGREQHKIMHAFHEEEEAIIRDVIILFDTGEEEFYDMLLPESLYDSLEDEDCFTPFGMRLLVWNESVALFAPNDAFFEIWVMNEFGGPKGAWTKHLTFELITEQSLTFWKSDEILMVDEYRRIVSYNLDTKKLNYLTNQTVPNDDCAAVVYVNSIVSISGGNKATSLREAIDNSS